MLAKEWLSQAKNILENENDLSYLIDAKGDTGRSKTIFLIATSAFTTITFLSYGIGIESALALLFTWGVIILALIDARHHILPDIIIYPLTWIGLIANDFNLFCNISDALWGVIAGYGVLWVINKLFMLITKVDGIGHGDLKMLAMIGAWTGLENLPLTITIASSVGAFTVIVLRLNKTERCKSSIPFGPFLAIGGWVVLLWGKGFLN